MLTPSPIPYSHLEYLRTERCLTDETIEKFIGFTEINGAGWLTIRVNTDNDGGHFFKLRAAPGNASVNKMMVTPSGSPSTLFGKGVLTMQGIHRVYICEGEFDCILLLQENLPAVTSSAGASTWKDEWCSLFPQGCEVVICYDNDDAGDKGREKVADAFMRLRPDCQLFDISFADSGVKGFDVTDFYRQCKEQGIVVATALTERTTRRVRNDGEVAGQKEEDGEGKVMGRTSRPWVTMPAPATTVTYAEWAAYVGERFPFLLDPARVCLSAMTQPLIHDVHNCCAIVLIDEASSGKTVTLNFFTGAKELVEASDEFTPASFVTHIAGRDKKALAEIDMLPRLRGRTMLVRELAPLFGEREDDLRKSLGVVTRVLDGEGYQSNSGVHGSRGYQGDYVFSFLGASKPLQLRVWKVMREFGHRLFFLGMRTPMEEEEDLMNILERDTFKKKEEEVKELTTQLIRSIWQAFPEGVHWQKEKDDRVAYRWMARLAPVLAHLRGEIIVYEVAKDESGRELSHTRPSVEHPTRILSTLRNLAAGHAVANLRDYITVADLFPVIRTALDSAPDPRPEILRLLITQGTVTSPMLVTQLRISAPKARMEMEKLIQLGLCISTKYAPGPMEAVTEENEGLWQPVSEYGVYGGSTQGDPKAMTLAPKFAWLREPEFAALLRDLGIDASDVAAKTPREDPEEPQEL